MARLAYIAIMCEEPGNLKDFYGKWFGFEELYQTEWGTIHLTDGTTNIALMKRGMAIAEENQVLGLHHIGFEIDSIDETEKCLKELNPSARIERRPAEDPFAQWRTWDPEGLPIDLTERGFGRDGKIGDAKRIPGIRHIAHSSCSPPREHQFYMHVFGMRDVTRTAEDRVVQGSEVITTPSRFAGDGYINLAFRTYAQNLPDQWTRIGFNHFGLLVRSPYELMLEIAQGDPSRIDQRPPDRFAEYRTRDPEGNAIDLSEKKGFKVDSHQTDAVRD